MKVTEKEGNYLLEVSSPEVEILTAALLGYEEATVLHLDNLSCVGANRDTSLSLNLRPVFVSRAVKMGKQLAEIVTALWTEA